MVRPHRTAPTRIGFMCLMLVLLGTGGCAVLGVIADKMPKPPIKARYAGLAGKQVAIIVWADRGTRVDYATLRSELTREVARKIRMASPAAEELKGTYVVDAAKVIKWQKDHPEYDGRAIDEVGPILAAHTGADRIVYVELVKFTTRDAMSDALLKGVAEANIRVAEITGSKAKVAYEEVGIEALFPDKAPEGVPLSQSVTIEYVYGGLVNELTKQIAVRFFTAEADAK